MGGRFSSKLDESFIKAGLKNVTLQRLEIPAGKRIVDEKLAQLSIEPFKLTIPTVIGAARAMSLDLPESIYDRLEERFENEMLETGAIFGTFVAWAKSLCNEGQCITHSLV
ncbi:methyltransferase [Colletotrichum kahawae]|uniref:Methyltransferase n=1 Tax=Colletotrichum kahawae TaxID=34407 RepID=A0AAE0CWK4_COLKA|nr:methyltransferase [Colletotrichum kahawae]